MLRIRTRIGVIAAFMSAISLVSQETDALPEVRADLGECIRMALKNSHAVQAQKYSIRAAESKLKQARSGRYPSLDLTAASIITDEDINFIFPSAGMQIPAMTLGSFSMPELEITIPEQNIKMADRLNGMTDLSLMWPLYTGGKISALVSQAKAGIAMAECESGANEDRIVYETKKLYYSVILASSLEKIAQQAHDRLSATLKIIEVLYREGSGNITKSDYLKNKVYVNAAQSLIHQISGEGECALTALSETVGLKFPAHVIVADDQIPFETKEEPIDSLMIRLNKKNPHIARVGFALDYYHEKIREAGSGRLPSLALVGSWRRILSNWDYGMTTRQNKDLWTVGIGLKMNLFDGFRTCAAVDENRAVLNRVSEQREMLKQGLELNCRVLAQKIEAAREREKSMREAVDAAVENCKLVERAYFSEIMELSELLRAQITEAVIKAQYQMILFEHADLQAQLDRLLAYSPEAGRN